MLTTDKVQRTRVAIERLGRAGLGLEVFSREALDALRRAVPFDGYCWSTSDPTTLLPSWAMVEDTPPGIDQKRFWELEFHTDDVNRRTALARYPRLVGTLRQATGGDAARSLRWDELLRPGGVHDELRAAFVLDDICWGTLTLYRDRGSGDFTPDEAALLGQLGGPLAAGLRTAMVSEPLRFQETVEGPGLLILGPDLGRIASTPLADRWLGRLGPPSPEHPSVVYGLVAHLRMLELTHARPDLLARTRVRLGDGRWLVLHAARLAGAGAAGQVAVVLEPARPADLAPLLVRGYRLSARERAVAEQVLLGRSTAEIGMALGITPYTVRDHLKAIFAKVGVRSRRELGQALAARTGFLAVDRHPDGAAQESGP